MTKFETRRTDGFEYVDAGPGSGLPVVLLHGMLGGVENWDSTARSLSAAGYRAVVPSLPVYRMPLGETSVSGLAGFVSRFLDCLSLVQPVLVGNSLGGHVALMHALDGRQPISGLALTGASGIHEVIVGNSKLKRYDRDYVREKAAMTFYDTRHVTEDLLDGILRIVRDRASAVRLIKMARSAKNDTVRDRLGNIRVPSLLIWGREDRLTPVRIAIDFQARMQDSRLEIISECGHAPMIERPDEFGRILIEYLDDLCPSTNGTNRSQKRHQTARN